MFAALLTIVICAILAIVMFKGEREHKEINNNYKNFKKNKTLVVAAYDDIMFQKFKKNDIMTTYPITHPDDDNLICIELCDGTRSWANMSHIKWLKNLYN